MYRRLLTIVCVFFIVITSCEKNDEFDIEPAPNSTKNPNTQIELEISSFNNLEGVLALAVFNNSYSFESGNGAYLDSTISIVNSEMTILLNDINTGTYAISVFHDADNNGDITLGGFLNLIPQEGFGFSNNPKIGMSQPNYSECTFTIEKDDTLIIPITLIYL